MSRNRIKVGVIGTGMASLPHGKSLAALSGMVEVCGVYSPSSQRREKFSSTFGFPSVGEIEAITGNSDIEFVLLLTPPNARLEIVEQLAASGKHILMEKPVERTLQAATRIVEICEANDVQLGIVFQHRFRDASMALKKHLPELGNIYTAEVTVPWWREQSYYDEPGRGTLARDGGGVLMSQAIHTLDLLLSFIGSVESVTAMHGTSGFHQMECEDFVTGGIRFTSGTLCSLHASTASYPGGSESITLHGEHGSALLAGGELTINFRDGRQIHVGEESTSGGGADPMDFPHIWHQRLISRFLSQSKSASATALTDFPDGRSSLQVHALIEALIQSGTEHTRVQPKPVSQTFN